MIVKENKKSITRFPKTAPDIRLSSGPDKDPLIDGYREGLKNSYAKELVKRYLDKQYHIKGKIN